MIEGQFSRTALGAAGHRAVHQVLEGGRIFADPLALRILGDESEAIVEEARREPRKGGLRFFVNARSRVAEDAAARALAAGCRQVVVLGAGLDTFAYRLPTIPGLRCFEIDHPSTQAEKRRRLAAAGIAIPEHLTYAPCDFETSHLGEALASAGFDSSRPSFFHWLGVVPYLTEAAIFATLGYIAALPGGGEVVCDYANPVGSIDDPRMREAHRILAERVAAAGETLQTFFVTTALHERLRALGFGVIEDWGPNELAARFLPSRASPGRANGGHVLRAAT